MVTGLTAVLRTAMVQPGENVVVYGAGGVGLNTIQGARLANAGMIIAIDRIESKLELARAFGATHTVLADGTDPVQAVLDLTGGRGVDYAFEVIGSPELMSKSLQMLNIGGMLILVGGAPLDATVAFHPRALLGRQQTIRGCNYGSCRPALDFPMFADWYMDGKLKLDELLTGEIGLDELPALYEQHPSQTDIRTVVKFADAE